MTGADLALAALINRAAQAYTYHRPTYVTYTENSHIEGFGQKRDINRSISVRVADDYAVMRDLPQGGQNVGEAFPMIPFFDAFSNFRFCYTAPNTKKIDITFTPGAAEYLKTPDPDTSVDIVVPYFSELAPHYAPDSTETALHFLNDPTPRTKDYLYASEVVEDPASQLPSHVTMKQNNGDMIIGLDYSMVQGYWMITRGTYTATEHTVIGFSFKVTATTTFSDFSFSDTAPDPLLAGPPSPHPAATCAPS
ncbi:MAG: hypothetical protein JO322_11230 [Candidatus Eremiobacteraeota bacterium]|nr:hypothetical protein [Candidatus Eremiobacteraeota bacterium]